MPDQERSNTLNSYVWGHQYLFNKRMFLDVGHVLLKIFRQSQKLVAINSIKITQSIRLVELNPCAHFGSLFQQTEKPIM